MSGGVEVTLPGGRWVDGERVPGAHVRPLVGADEVALVDLVGRVPGPRLATTVLARCVTRCGPQQADERLLRSLTAGDREALLWHVRRLTVGEALGATLTCQGCGEKAAVELSVGDLLHAPYPQWAPTFREQLAGHEVAFRLPVGADLERLGTSAADVPAAVDRLVAACLLEVDGGAPTAAHRSALRDGLSQRMAALDPQAEAVLSTTCPACGADLVATLDAVTFLSEELVQRARHLFTEVHVLASTYHWSERDILAMTGERRRVYLELIDAERSSGRGGRA